MTVYEVVPLNGQSGDVIVRGDETVPATVPLHVHFSKAYFENGKESPSTTAFTGLVATLLRLSSSSEQVSLTQVPWPALVQHASGVCNPVHAASCDAPVLVAVAEGIFIDTSQPAGVVLKNSTKGNVAVLLFTEVIEVNTRLFMPPAGTLNSPVASDSKPTGTIAPPVSAVDARPVVVV